MTISFIVSGHVDHGKSTFLGHLLVKVSHFDERTITSAFERAQKNKMEKWKYAYLLDTLEEEELKGKTSESINVDFEYNGNSYTMIDTPGHSRLVKEVLRGINTVNPKKLIGCLIVSVDPNEFAAGMLNGQTKEDAILLKVSGINHLVIIFNKIDLVDKETIDKCRDELMKFINTLNFKSTTCCNVSGFYGTGLTEFIDLVTRIHTTHNLENVLQEDEKKVITTRKIKCDLKLINCENKIISAGTRCIMHCSDKEYQVDFLFVKNKGTNKNFGRNNEVISCVIGKIDESPFDVSIGDRVIIREDTKTIGFGIIKS